MAGAVYIRESLGEGEELIHLGRFHWMYTFKAVMGIFWSFLGTIAVLCGAF